MPTDELREPWRSFLAALDGALSEPVTLHCCGGFVVTQLYQVPRQTQDVDFLDVVPFSERRVLVDLAGRGSPLHQQFGVYLDAVTIATPPVDYADRLRPLYPGVWRGLELLALEAHDVVLAKLERNSQRDREDVQALARAGYLDRDTLQRRYHDELRPYLLSRHTWHDGTLQNWLESYWP